MRTADRDADLPHEQARESDATKRGAPAGAPLTCLKAAARRYGECSSQTNPTRRGGQKQMAKKTAKGGKKKGGKKR